MESSEKFANMAKPTSNRSQSATEAPAAIELAIRLLEAHHPPDKVEAALVYRGYSQQTARELVQGVLSGRIENPASENDEHPPKDWGSIPDPYLLALGLALLTIMVCVAATGKVGVRHIGGLVFALMLSCTSLQRLLGPKQRDVSTTLCLLLIIVAIVAARSLRLPH